MQSLRRYVLLAPLVAVAVAYGDAVPAGAKDTGVCTLLTRAEAGKLLGAKVYSTATKTSAADGAQRCTYKTNKVQKESKHGDLKIQLELTVQPVTDTLRSQLQRIPSNEGQRVEGLGDEAYATKFDYVIAIVGNVAVQAKLQNYEGSPTKFRDVSEGAVRTALTRLDRVTVSPPS